MSGWGEGRRRGGGEGWLAGLHAGGLRQRRRPLTPRCPSPPSPSPLSTPSLLPQQQLRPRPDPPARAAERAAARAGAGGGLCCRRLARRLAREGKPPCTPIRAAARRAVHACACMCGARRCRPACRLVNACRPRVLLLQVKPVAEIKRAKDQIAKCRDAIRDCVRYCDEAGERRREGAHARACTSGRAPAAAGAPAAEANSSTCARAAPRPASPAAPCCYSCPLQRATRRSLRSCLTPMASWTWSTSSAQSAAATRATRRAAAAWPVIRPPSLLASLQTSAQPNARLECSLCGCFFPPT